MSASNPNPSASQGLSVGERVQLTEAAGGAPAAGSATWAIVQRELSSLFFSPIAYIVGFIFLFMTGWFFLSETLVSGSEASMRLLFERMAAVLVFALPLLTMRSISDEFASGTIETLMTAPVTDASVIIGKFLGALTFFMALLATGKGNSVVTEKIYPDRFMHVAELNRMAANLRKEGPNVIVAGVDKLIAAPVMASDLRASAALVLAGMAAEGTTLVQRVYHIDRGYYRIEERLNAVGAKIRRESV